MKLLRNVAAVLLLLGTTQASAQVAALSHISASVIGALNINEVQPMNFGNFAIICTGGTCDAASSIVLSDQGTRTATSAGLDSIALFNGAGNGGIANGTNQETGAQSPGFYTINTGGETPGSQNVYVSFADANGDLIDINHPANHVSLSGPIADAFTVDTFTFESDTHTTGYIQENPSQHDVYGYYVPLNSNGTVTIRVGATLHTAAVTTPPPGKYTGTYNIEVSY